jgi:hypothetical protein
MHMPDAQLQHMHRTVTRNSQLGLANPPPKPPQRRKNSGIRPDGCPGQVLPHLRPALLDHRPEPQLQPPATEPVSPFRATPDTAGLPKHLLAPSSSCNFGHTLLCHTRSQCPFHKPATHSAYLSLGIPELRRREHPKLQPPPQQPKQALQRWQRPPLRRSSTPHHASDGPLRTLGPPVSTVCPTEPPPPTRPLEPTKFRRQQSTCAWAQHDSPQSTDAPPASLLCQPRNQGYRMRNPPHPRSTGSTDGNLI